MINLTNLIKFIKEYKIDPKFTFYKDCITKLEELKDKEKEEINKIQNFSYLLEPIRLYLLNNIDSFKFILSTEKCKKCSYVKYELSEQEMENFLIIIELMESKKSNILELKNIDTKDIKTALKLSKSDNVLYFNIIDNDEDKDIPNSIEIKNYYDTISFLLGIESIRILKHQRLDRIKEFLNDPEAFKVFNILQNYNKYVHSLTFEERDKYIIHSGSILEALGTTYTRDVDVIIFSFKQPHEVKQLINDINSKYEDIDPNVIDINGDYHVKVNEEPLKYKKQWLTYQLPSTDGAQDIFDVNVNPVFHFHFAGMKFFNINLTLNRFLQRASISSMADLLMLYELNKIDIRNKICLPNMTIRQGRIVVFHGEYLDKYFNGLQKALKEYYKKDYKIDELKKQIKYCNEEGFDIYKGAMVKDPDTDIIKFFHILIKKEIIKKYASNANYLLDIGSGKLTDMRIWEEFNIKNVVGIEPSTESIKLGEERLEKHGFKGDLKVINGVGDEDWVSVDKYNIALKNKYDVITFQFTLHYMMNNIDVVINNLKKVMLPKCKIIITCMDGNKIHTDFQRYKYIEVRNRQEPIFAIIPMYDTKKDIPEKDNNIIVYFKGAYGVSSGSIEPIIDINKLIRILKENDIHLIERKNFSEYNIDIKKRMGPHQLRVSSYYMSLVFENK